MATRTQYLPSGTQKERRPQDRSVAMKKWKRNGPSERRATERRNAPLIEGKTTENWTKRKSRRKAQDE
jgi:hypothetical protein